MVSGKNPSFWFSLIANVDEQQGPGIVVCIDPIEQSAHALWQLERILGLSV